MFFRHISKLKPKSSLPNKKGSNGGDIRYVRKSNETDTDTLNRRSCSIVLVCISACSNEFQRMVVYKDGGR